MLQMRSIMVSKYAVFDDFTRRVAYFDIKLTHVYIWIADVSITDFRSLNQEHLEQWAILKWLYPA